MIWVSILFIGWVANFNPAALTNWKKPSPRYAPKEGATEPAFGWTSPPRKGGLKRWLRCVCRETVKGLLYSKKDGNVRDLSQPPPAKRWEGGRGVGLGFCLNENLHL